MNVAVQHQFAKPKPIRVNEPTDEMLPWLERAAATTQGIVCFPYQVKAIGPLLASMAELGLITWHGAYGIEITDAGRLAVNGPSTAEINYRQLQKWHAGFAEAAEQKRLAAEQVRADLIAEVGIEEATRRFQFQDDLASPIDYRKFHRTRQAAILCVKLDDRGTTIKASRDGSTAPAFWLKRLSIWEHPASRGNLVLAMIPRNYCKYIAETFAGVSLLGVTPDLDAAAQWTDWQRAMWADLATLARKINHDIEMIDQPKRRSRGSSGIRITGLNA